MKRRKNAIKRGIVPHCPKCGHAHAIKSGLVNDGQRWKCKACAFQFTRITPRGRPLWQKALAVFLYSYGVPMRRIGDIFQVRPSTVLKWVRLYAQDARAPELGDVNIMAFDALQRQLKKGRRGKGTLCIAINDTTFRKSLGITVDER